MTRPVRLRRPSKYRARPCVIDGIRFASQAEGRRYRELRLLEKAGEIRGLVTQPVYQLWASSVRHRGPSTALVGRYLADFRYQTRDGRTVVEDVKGGSATRTALYRLKRKIVEANYDITITEVS